MQYLSIKYTERLAEAGIEPSVGSVGDSYDNALAETINGLYKTEVIRRCGPWRSLEAVEFATLEWVDRGDSQAGLDVIHHARRWSMGRAYSLDLRERVAGHVAEGGSRREAGRRYGVSASTAVRIAASQATRGTLVPRKQGRPPGRGKLAAYIDFLIELVEAVPDITMPELARALEAEHGVKAHPSSISRVLIRAGMSYKENR